ICFRCFTLRCSTVLFPGTITPCFVSNNSGWKILNNDVVWSGGGDGTEIGYNTVTRPQSEASLNQRGELYFFLGSNSEEVQQITIILRHHDDGTCLGVQFQFIGNTCSVIPGYFAESGSGLLPNYGTLPGSYPAGNEYICSAEIIGPADETAIINIAVANRATGVVIGSLQSSTLGAS